MKLNDQDIDFIISLILIVLFAFLAATNRFGWGPPF
jgi:hypothetical protein